MKKKLTQFKPPHIGEVLRELYLKPLNLEGLIAAQFIGIGLKRLEGILYGKNVEDNEIELLASIFKTTPQYWHNIQDAYNENKIRNKKKLTITLEKTNTGYSAYFKELNVFSVGSTIETTLDNIKESLKLYLSSINNK